MVSLVDLVDLNKTVTVRGKELPVEGIDGQKLGFLLSEFPELRMIFAGRGAELNPKDLIGMGPRIVASVIAAGLGETGKTAAIEAAEKLTIGEQLTVLSAIFDVTFPDGVGPFVEKARSWGLFDEGGVGASGWARAMNSQKPSRPLAPAVDGAAPNSSA